MVPLHEFLSVADRGAADRETLNSLKKIVGQMTVLSPILRRLPAAGLFYRSLLSKWLHGVPGIGKTAAQTQPLRPRGLGEQPNGFGSAITF